MSQQSENVNYESYGFALMLALTHTGTCSERTNKGKDAQGMDIAKMKLNMGIKSTVRDEELRSFSRMHCQTGFLSFLVAILSAFQSFSSGFALRRSKRPTAIQLRPLSTATFNPKIMSSYETIRVFLGVSSE
jgi:hypothetical protein